MSGETERPKRIYLQRPDDDDDDSDATWCEDRIEPSDTEYIRADLVATPPGYEMVPEGTMALLERIEYPCNMNTDAEPRYECALCPGRPGKPHSPTCSVGAAVAATKRNGKET